MLSSFFVFIVMPASRQVEEAFGVREVAGDFLFFVTEDLKPGQRLGHLGSGAMPSDCSVETSLRRSSSDITDAVGGLLAGRRLHGGVQFGLFAKAESHWVDGLNAR